MGTQLDQLLQKADDIAASGAVHPDHVRRGTHVLKAYKLLSDDDRWSLIREVIDQELQPDPYLQPVITVNVGIRTQIYDHMFGVLITEWQRRQLAQTLA